MKLQDYLDLICKNCLFANGHCIKDDVYIGLCSENDKEELIEIFYEKQKSKQ